MAGPRGRHRGTRATGRLGRHRQGRQRCAGHAGWQHREDSRRRGSHGQSWRASLRDRCQRRGCGHAAVARRPRRGVPSASVRGRSQYSEPSAARGRDLQRRLGPAARAPYPERPVARAPAGRRPRATTGAARQVALASGSQARARARRRSRSRRRVRAPAAASPEKTSSRRQKSRGAEPATIAHRTPRRVAAPHRREPPELAALLNTGVKFPVPNCGYGSYRVPSYRPKKAIRSCRSAAAGGSPPITWSTRS